MPLDSSLKTAPWFFLSYARSDASGDLYVEDFVKRLSVQVRILSGDDRADVGFFDQQDINPGSVWPDALRKALETTRTMVCLYSRTYFTREYCGKEFQAFYERTAQLSSQAAPPNGLILPVILVPPKYFESAMPATVRTIQYDSNGYPEEYRRDGLLQVMRRPEQNNTLDNFVYALARMIVDKGSFPLRPGRLAELAEIRSAFHQRLTQVAQAQARNETAGPRIAQFIFVAGNSEELKSVRKDVTSYGSAGRDWRPYYPPSSDEAGLLAQSTTSAERLHYEVLPMDQDVIPAVDSNQGVIDELKRAQDRNKITVLVVDPWTAKLKRYEDLLRLFDQQNFFNCAVLVPFNDQDPETTPQRAALSQSIRQLFEQYVKISPYFRISVSSAQAFHDELSVIFNQIRARLIRIAEVPRKPAGASEHSLPLLRGPSGLR
jgi:FxsC-like protein